MNAVKAISLTSDCPSIYRTHTHTHARVCIHTQDTLEAPGVRVIVGSPVVVQAMILTRANAAMAPSGASMSPAPGGNPPGGDNNNKDMGGYVAGLVILAIIIIALIAALVIVVLKKQQPAGLPVTSSSTTNPVYEISGGK